MRHFPLCVELCVTAGKVSALSPLVPSTSPKPPPNSRLGWEEPLGMGVGQVGSRLRSHVVPVPPLGAQDRKQVCREKGMSPVSDAFSLRCSPVRTVRQSHPELQAESQAQRCFHLLSQGFPNVAKLWNRLEALKSTDAWASPPESLM